jgi:hypothetical protein
MAQTKGKKGLEKKWSSLMSWSTFSKVYLKFGISTGTIRSVFQLRIVRDHGKNFFRSERGPSAVMHFFFSFAKQNKTKPEPLFLHLT